MNSRVKKLFILVVLLSTSLSMFAIHYINNTGKIIKITNVSAKKRSKKNKYFNTRKRVQQRMEQENLNTVYFIELENEAEGDLDNKQGDEITITSDGMSNKRRLFPTNNSFNYVITMNNYKSKYEKFDINHAE